MIIPLDIRGCFEEFVAAAYRGSVGPDSVQYMECERAFVAGMHALLCHMLTFDDAVTGDAELERLLAETRDFGKRVGGSGGN